MRSTFVSFYMKYNDELVMSLTKMSPVKSADGFMMKSKVYCPMRGSFANLGDGIAMNFVNSTSKSADGFK